MCASRKITWTRVVASMLLLSAMPAAAQQAPDGADQPPGEQEIRHYTVEFIVFEYSAAAGGTTETFLPEVPEPSPEREDTPPGTPGELAEPMLPPEFETPSALVPDEPLVEIPVRQQVEMSLLDPADYTLGSIYRRLENVDAYIPLLHAGWTQAAAERGVTPSIRLRALGEAPLRLDGSLTLYLGRFLHLVVDLALDDDLPQPVSPMDTRIPTYGDQRSGFGYDDLDPRRQPIRYRITEDRIVKSGDLRYFDHPKFGVLAKVTRAEPTGDQQPLPDDDTADLLPANPRR